MSIGNTTTSLDAIKESIKVAFKDASDLASTISASEDGTLTNSPTQDDILDALSQSIADGISDYIKESGVWPNGTNRLQVRPYDQPGSSNRKWNPSTPQGGEGDEKGMITISTSYVYVCIKDFDDAASGEAIWKRASLSTW